MTNWKATALWKHLAAAPGPEAEAAQALLRQEMPRIHTILTQAHTAPTDFTLHDADHSFRVAKWMAEIIPGDVLEKLSPYEITLLLLAAYLHDIGMTPEQGRVDRFWSHLVYGAPDPKGPRQPLTEEAARDLQGWLDDEGRDLTIPLALDGAASEETKRLADLLIAHYCRHKHNDWSGEWIKAHLRREALPSYESWVDDLIQLCRSHHEGYDDLKQSRFDPRPAGSSGQPVHHRYLACVLRVADVLEIDPERTPEVIFRHREIHPGSVLYWRKDHENWVFRDGNNLSLAAYPESAVVENAIRRTADGIRQELTTCARLNREQPFFHWQLRPNQQLPHRWDFPEVLTVHVQPRNDAYVYIDGAFRPNTEKLLELLSGTQLYGDPLVAVRELLQNAFDAVKEEMAYQRLERPTDPDFAKHLAAMHRVELRVEERDGRKWLICKDTGVGMTRRIIEEYLLVSGNSRRREIVELERRCREVGFRLGRTGQFGIGVLSYFMLADRVEIRTRRSAARADAEATGWSFVTEGVGSFGELKKEPWASTGTEVRLRLRDERRLWSLSSFLEKTVRHIPCTLKLHGFWIARRTKSWEAGWVQSLAETTEETFRDPFSIDYPSRRSDREAAEQFVRDWLDSAREAVRWRVEEGRLPDNLGIYRISVPWFELPGGRCEAFMLLRPEVRHSVIIPPMNGLTGIIPKFKLMESVHGMGLKEGFYKDSGVGFREINWESSEAGRLRVDRSSLDASPLASNAKRRVDARAREVLMEVLSEEPSEYAFLSEDWPRVLRTEPCWPLSDSGEFIWGPIPFPVAFSNDFTVGDARRRSYRGKDLTILFPFRFPDQDRLPSFFKASPDRLMARSQRSSFGIVRIWEDVPESDRVSPLGRISQLPPEWRKICGVSFYDSKAEIWNVEHPIVSQVDQDSARWLKELVDQGSYLDLAALNEEIFVIPGRAAGALAWVFSYKASDIEDIWTRFLERAPSLVERLLSTAFGLSAVGDKENLIGFLKLAGHEQWELIVLTSDSVIIAEPGEPFFEDFLPPPGPHWTITEASSDDEPT